MGNVINVLAGPIDVFIGPDGESLPETDDLEPPSITVTPGGNWAQIGFTIENFNLILTPTHNRIVVNERNAPVKHVLTAEDCEFSVVLAEDDMQAWSEAYNAGTLTTQAAAADVTAQDLFAVGSGTVTVKSLLLLGTNPEGGSRLVHCFHVVQTSPSDWARGREHQGHTVTFDFQSDTAKTAGEDIYKARDITAVASS